MDRGLPKGTLYPCPTGRNDRTGALASRGDPKARVWRHVQEVVADIALGRKRKPVRGKLWRRISLSAGTTQLDLSSKLKSRLGQRRPSEKSREAGRPGNAKDRQPMKAALVDNNPHGRLIAAGRQLAPFGRTYKDFISELHLYLPPKIPQQIILITVPISQFNLCCIISSLWRTLN